MIYKDKQKPIPSVSSRPTTPGYNFNNQMQETYDTDQILSQKHNIGLNSLQSEEVESQNN